MFQSVFRSGLGVLVAGAMVLGSSSYAVEIMGTFTLTADIQVGDPNSGQDIASGTFTFDDESPVMPLIVGEDIFDNTILLTDVTITDITSGTTGDFVFDDFIAGSVAVLGGPTSNSTVIGLLATSVAGNNPSIDLTFDEANGTQGTFDGGSFGIFTDGIDTFSGNQAIPEPSALALFGAGLLAFGAFRFRKSA